VLLFLVVVTATAIPARAQEAAGPAARPAPEAKPVETLKLTIVLAHYDAERKVSSTPYTLTVTTGTQSTANMGVQVPVPNNAGPTGQVSFTYKNIGTNVSCTADRLDDGRYRLHLTVEESSVLPDKSGNSSSVTAGVPAFADFIVSSTLTLRDGGMAQYASGTNPLTGQVTRIEVSGEVVK
jgi:hypothetical protein